MKKRVKKKFNFLRFIIFILVIVLIYFLVSILLNIKTKNIIILNNSYYSDEKIIETCHIEDYPKFILLNKNKLKKKLLSLELIDDVNIYKKWGFILKIDVKEKKILYFIRSTETYKASDNNNYDIDNYINVPTLINYVPEETEKTFVNNFKNVDSKVISMISEIEYNKTSYDDNRFLLHMNDGNQVYVNSLKIDILNKYVSIIRKLEGKKGILHLDSGNYFEIKE